MGKSGILANSNLPNFKRVCHLHGTPLWAFVAVKARRGAAAVCSVTRVTCQVQSVCRAAQCCLHLAALHQGRVKGGSACISSVHWADLCWMQAGCFGWSRKSTLNRNISSTSIPRAPESRSTPALLNLGLACVMTHGSLGRLLGPVCTASSFRTCGWQMGSTFAHRVHSNRAFTLLNHRLLRQQGGITTAQRSRHKQRR